MMKWEKTRNIYRWDEQWAMFWGGNWSNLKRPKWNVWNEMI